MKERHGMNQEEHEDRTTINVEDLSTAHTYVHDQGKTYFDGPCSAWAFFDSVRETVTGEKTRLPNENEKKTAYKHFITDPPSQSIFDARMSLLAALPPQPVIDFLAASFFRYSQSNYFITHLAIFSRKLAAFIDGNQEFDLNTTSRRCRSSSDFPCILFMVLAIGAQYADLGQGQSSESKGSRSDSAIPTSGSEAEPKPERNPGWPFYQISKRLLADVVSSCSMASVQACLLQGAFLMTTTAHDAAYNLLGVAMRMAINMGMHRYNRTNGLHRQVHELRNQLWWSVYALERLFTFQLGRSIMIEDDEIDTPFPVDLPELQVPEYTSPVIYGQIAIVRVLQIKGRILRTMYSGMVLSGRGRVIDVQVFQTLITELEDWRKALPMKLQLAESSTRGIIHLHLTYEHAVMLLSRTALAHMVSLCSNSSRSDRQATPTEAHTSFLRKAANNCLTAASSTISLFRTLRQRKLLCSYSCLDPLYCSGALHVLLLGAKIATPDSEARKMITQGINVLRDLAKGSETAAASLKHIEPAFSTLFQDVDRRASSSSPRSLEADGYLSWKAWKENLGGSLASNVATLSLPDTVMPEITDKPVQGQTFINSMDPMLSPEEFRPPVARDSSDLHFPHLNALPMELDGFLEPPYWLSDLGTHDNMLQWDFTGILVNDDEDSG
ncbi:fungal-specific transcription factor domain-containing protein [Aspergillus multicolor]|uniref:fungal specific transcription factor domain-containing protein n=1 Tax=Aspergillus multicolor TaxID=41759 RepID=UPI003CCD2171